MALADELERIAALRGRGPRCSPPRRSRGERIYLCAFERTAAGGPGSRSTRTASRSRSAGRVRDAVSIVALCELAEETAAGGDLDELRAQLVALRVTENPPGIDEAEEAALELQRVLGAPPALATPARLDAIGVATRTARARARRRAPGLAVRRRR